MRATMIRSLAHLAVAGLIFSLVGAVGHDAHIDAHIEDTGVNTKTFHKYPYGEVIIETTSDDTTDTFKFLPDANMVHIVKNIASMMLLKLLCGLDDLALLTALVGTKNVKQNNVNCVLYISFIAFVGVAAWMVAQTTYLLLDKVLGEGFWDVERVSSLVFGSLLFLFGIKEWYEGDDDEDEDIVEIAKDVETPKVVTSGEKVRDASEAEPLFQGNHRETCEIVAYEAGEGEGSDVKTPLSVGSPASSTIGTPSVQSGKSGGEGGIEDGRSTSDDFDADFVGSSEAHPGEGGVRFYPAAQDDLSSNDEPKVHDWSPYRYMGIIGMLALDDSVVFTCMIQGSEISLVEVMLGMIMGSVLIVCLCRVLSSIGIINDFLQRVPKWVLICGLGAWVAIGGLLDIGF